MNNYCSSILLKNLSGLSSDNVLKRISDVIMHQGLVSCNKETYEYAYKVKLSDKWVSIFASHWDEPSAARRREAADLSRELHMSCLSVGEYSILNDTSLSIEYFNANGEAVDYFGYGFTDHSGYMPKADWSAVMEDGYSTEQLSELLEHSYDSGREIIITLASCFGFKDMITAYSFQTAKENDAITTLYFKKKPIHKGKLPTVKTAFNDIFGAALEPFGFVRPKLRQPYYIRMVGDDILHIIGVNDMKTHISPFGAVATVYRKEMCLDKTIRQNEQWLDSVMKYYLWDCAGTKEYDKRIQSGFHYMRDLDPFSVTSAVSGALDAVLTWMLPQLNKVTSLKDILDYSGANVVVPKLPLSENHFAPPYSDMAVRFLLDDPVQDLDERYESSLRRLHDDAERFSHTPEMLAENLARCDKYLAESRKILELFLTDDDLRQQTINELNERKLRNTELLKKYGVL